MSKYIYKKPRKPAFSQKGLRGYTFPLDNKDIDVNYIDVKQGHDTYIISKELTHIYYIIKGKGVFDIEGKKYKVKRGVVVEVPPNVEYTYSGKMKVILINTPSWFEGNEVVIKDNPLVF